MSGEKAEPLNSDGLRAGPNFVSEVGSRFSRDNYTDDSGDESGLVDEWAEVLEVALETD